MESHVRTFAKTISWRVLGTLITSGVAFGITGEMKIAASLAVVDLLAKTVTYYIHERLWNCVKHGYTATNDGAGDGNATA